MYFEFTKPIKMNIKDIEQKYDSVVEIKPLKATDLDNVFPANKNAESKKQFRYTNVSIFSVTPIDQSLETSNLLLQFYDVKTLKKKTLTEIGSCIGGNTWSFAQLVEHVNAVEINKLHAEILAHNLKIMDANNVTIHNANYVDIRNELSQEIVFFDPPWGGLDYRTKKSYIIEITCGKTETIPLPKLVENIRAELIIIKLPLNHDVDHLRNIKKYFSIVIVSVPDKWKRDKTHAIYQLVLLSDVRPKHAKKDIFVEAFNYRDIKFDVVA